MTVLKMMVLSWCTHLLADSLSQLRRQLCDDMMKLLDIRSINRDAQLPGQTIQDQCAGVTHLILLVRDLHGNRPCSHKDAGSISWARTHTAITGGICMLVKSDSQSSLLTRIYYEMLEATRSTMDHKQDLFLQLLMAAHAAGVQPYCAALTPNIPWIR